MYKLKMDNKVIICLCAMMIVLCLISACQTFSPEEQDGSAELYHYNWWNFYKRGLARINEGNYEGAKTDFETCLGIRPGATYEYDQDIWRARTYGLHFIEGYFPSRELGICFYQLGQYERAREYLEKSVEQEPSGRAKYYLNLTRKELLAMQDILPPVINVGEKYPVWTDNRTMLVNGTAIGDGYIKTISIGNQEEFIELASREVGFSHEVNLQEGKNRIAVIAEDLMGQQAKQDVEVIADWQPPVLLVKSLSRDGDEWVFDAICVDNYALASMSLDDQSLGFYPTAVGLEKKSVPVRLTCPLNREVVFSATDASGNQFTTILPGDLAHLADYSTQLAVNQEAGVPDVASVAPERRSSSDRLKPSLSMLSVPATAVSDEEFYLDGSASDRGGLSSIQVNGEELLDTDFKGIIQYRFSRRLPLDVGTNAFVIAVTDNAGNQNVKDICIVRVLPGYLDPKYRLTMGVPPMVGSEIMPERYAAKKMVEVELLKQPVRFQLLERDEGWDYILREQRLGLSDLANPESALKIGKMLPAELLLMESIIPHDKGVTIYAKVVNTDNGQIVCAEDVYSEHADNDLAYRLAGLVMKIEQKFPLINGNIISLSNDKAIVGVGLRDGVRPGTTFIVADAGEGSAGEVKKVDTTPVELIVSKIEKDQSTARIDPKGARDAVQAGDYIYAR